MPRYKTEYTDEHYLVRLQDTGHTPILELVLRRDDVPFAVPLASWPPAEVVSVLYREVKDRPWDVWHPVSVRLQYRKHILDGVEAVPAT